MNYQEFIQPFYNSETKTSGLRGVQSQGETAEYFVDLAFAHEIPEEYISQPDTYRRWYTGRSNPKSTLWKEIEKAFDDKRFEEYSKEHWEVCDGRASRNDRRDGNSFCV